MMSFLKAIETLESLQDMNILFVKEGRLLQV